MALSWVSVHPQTGVILAELPDLVPQGPCAVTIGRYETLGFTLPYPNSVIAYAQLSESDRDPADPAIQALEDWDAATRPGGSVLIALDETGNPCWGGLVLTRTRDSSGQATLSTATMEAYFDRRYTGTYTGTSVDQNTLVATIINQFILDGALPGLPITVNNSASAQTRSVVYNSYDDHTVYANLGTLSGVLNGPQWTVGWQLQAGPLITPVLTVADRLGSPVRSGMGANAVFSMPGCVSQFQLTEDWSSGKGANRVTATGAGQGLTRPTDTETAANFQGRPTYEFRYAPVTTNPLTGIPSGLTVQGHAQAALAAIQDGTNVVTMTAAIADAPVLGVDWFIGDDIGYDIFAPGFIDGSMVGTGRCIGWSRDDYFVTPVLFVLDPSTL